MVSHIVPGSPEVAQRIAQQNERHYLDWVEQRKYEEALDARRAQTAPQLGVRAVESASNYRQLEGRVSEEAFQASRAVTTETLGSLVEGFGNGMAASMGASTETDKPVMFEAYQAPTAQELTATAASDASFLEHQTPIDELTQRNIDANGARLDLQRIFAAQN